MKKNFSLTPYLFLFPAGVIIVMFVFYPALRSFILSFTDYNMIAEPNNIGFQNYKDIIQDDEFWQSFKNTFIFLVIAVPSCVILPLLVAVLVQPAIWGISFFRASYYIPVVTSLVVSSLAWKWLMDTKGIINYVLSTLHVINSPIYWLTESSLVLFSIAIVEIWRGLGYYMVIYLAGLQSIDTTLYEAAEIDGATKLQQFRFITLPSLKPAIAVVSILSLSSGLKVFEVIYVMTKGGPANSSKSLVYYIYDHAFENLEMGYSSAVSMILFVVTLIVSLIYLRINYKKGENK